MIHLSHHSLLSILDIDQEASFYNHILNTIILLSKEAVNILHKAPKTNCIIKKSLVIAYTLYICHIIHYYLYQIQSRKYLYIFIYFTYFEYNHIVKQGSSKYPYKEKKGIKKNGLHNRGTIAYTLHLGSWASQFLVR